MTAEPALVLNTQDTAPVAEDYLAHVAKTKEEAPVTAPTPIQELTQTAEATPEVLIWNKTNFEDMTAANFLSGCLIKTGKTILFIDGWKVEDGILVKQHSFIKPLGKRGRPAGAKNKVKKAKAKGKRGRPKGSKNKVKKAKKAKAVKKIVKKSKGKRGRPKGSKNKVK